MKSISVIMNCIDENPQYFKEAVESILNQKDVSVHLILSTVEGDISIEWIKEYKGDIFVSAFPLKDHPGRSPEGSFAQLNYALQYVKHDWLCFCSSNDTIFDSKFADEIHCAESENKLMCYSNLHITDKDLNVTSTTAYGSFTRARHLQNNFMPDQSTINFKKLKKYLPFSVEWYNCGFWDFWMRVYEGEGDVFAYNPKPERYYRQLSNSMHIERNKNPEKVAMYKQQRALMLNTHQ